MLTLRLSVAALLAAASLLAGCSAPGLYRPAAPLYEVRTVPRITVHDPVQDRDVIFRLHYPVTDGPLPVVVYSHGAMCSPVNYDAVTRFWAAHGYAVLAPYHLDAMDNPRKLQPGDLPLLLSARVRDLSFALDALDAVEARAELGGRLERGRAAVAGHSFGGMITMIKSGLRLKPGEYRYPGPTADPRYVAAVVMSGVGPMTQMADDAFAGLTGPLLATGGTLDEGNIGSGEIFPWQWRMSAYRLAPPGDKYEVVLDRGDHYLGGLICRPDRGGPPDAGGLQIIQAETLAFLDAYLRNAPAALADLRRDRLAERTAGRASMAMK